VAALAPAPTSLTISDGQLSLAVSGSVAAVIWWLAQKRSQIESKESSQITFHIKRGRNPRVGLSQEEEIT
jgi:hypothetical protein